MQNRVPLICSHQGYNAAAPANTLAAFARGIEWGAQEIEFDLFPSKDGDLIACHDATVDRTTNGIGLITELTTKELRALDAGSCFSDAFKGEKLPLFEEILDHFGKKAVFNIHIKSIEGIPVKSPAMDARIKRLLYNCDGNRIVWPMPEKEEGVLPELEEREVRPYDEKTFQTLLDLLDAYGCRGSVYITGERDVLMTALSMAPDIPRCCLEGHMNYSIIDNALRYKCSRVQFTKGFTTQRMIDRARAEGLICNLFWSDNLEEARRYADAGIDCLLVNNLGAVDGILE